MQSIASFFFVASGQTIATRAALNKKTMPCRGLKKSYFSHPYAHYIE